MRSPETTFNSTQAEAPAPVKAPSRIRVWLLAALLALVTMAVYWPATRCDFNSYDDQDYVTANPHVQGGLTWAGMEWAFLNPVSSNWHPVTMLSHMLDCQLFGLKPWGHHLTSVLLHAINTVLVFLLLFRMTGHHGNGPLLSSSLSPQLDTGSKTTAAIASAWQAGAMWRSLLVAALFGLHPVHVESVAWVSERKDLLSTFFFLLTLLFYARFARGIKSGSNGQVASEATIENTSQRPSSIFHLPSSSSYYLALVFFALGLMSKPMLVTVPFVLLLLDYWPLRRVTCDGWRVASLDSRHTPSIHQSINPPLRLFLEKLPFFGLAAAVSVVTFVVQNHSGSMQMVQTMPLSARAGNALIAYCRYLGKLFWPVDLAVFYPHPGYWPLEQVVLAGGLLLGITVLFIVLRRQYPFMLMGWLWFCGTLVPVIGLVQVGEQAMADRYTYIPSLGVLILAIWGAYELTRSWRYQVMALSVAGGAAIVVCLALTRQQLGYWQDNETLFRHALAVTENNFVAHNNLGMTLAKHGQYDEAISQIQEAIRLKPHFAIFRNSLGTVLGQNGRIDEAISQLQEAIRLKPDYAEAYSNLGDALSQKGQADEAIELFQKAIRLKPDDAEAHNNLGAVLNRKGRIDEAIGQLQEAIRLKPDYAEAHCNLGIAFGMEGRIDEAISQFQEAIRLKPDYAEACFNLGNAFGMKGQTDDAISQYREAIRLKPDYAEACNNLGSNLGMKGQINEAISQFQEAVRLKPDFTDAQNNLARALKVKNAPSDR
ncbi:MAG: tetratricopeptide repeat protein [Verrucomicrobiota bacterium]